MTQEELVRLDQILLYIRNEVISATEKFGPFHSSHEGYAIIQEELDELWDEIKSNRRENWHDEAKQVAAMGARFMFDLC